MALGSNLSISRNKREPRPRNSASCLALLHKYTHQSVAAMVTALTFLQGTKGKQVGRETKQVYLKNSSLVFLSNGPLRVQVSFNYLITIKSRFKAFSRDYKISHRKISFESQKKEYYMLSYSIHLCLFVVLRVELESPIYY